MQVEARTIASIADEWDELADRVRSTPFTRPGWISAWWDAFGQGSLKVLSSREGNRLTGVMPIVREGSFIHSPTNLETPLYGFVTEGDASARCLTATLVSSGARHLRLSTVDREDVGLRSLEQGLRASGFRAITQPNLVSPFLTTTGAWTAYKETVDAKVRSEMRRRRRRLEGIGALSFDVVDGSERLDAVLEDGFRVEGSGWKGEYGTAINSDRRTRRFYRNVARWAAERGWLRLAFLRLDGRSIAFDLCLEADGVHYLVKTGFDHDFGRFGPGVILRSQMLQRAFEGPVETYEFLGTVDGANNDWKLTWADRSHQRMQIDAFAPSILGSAEWLMLRYGVPSARRARALAVAALGPSGRDLAKRWRARARRRLVP